MGELEKRIKQKAYIEKSYIGSDGSEERFMADHIELEDLKEIVGEMRKEFLEIQGKESIQELHKYYQLRIAKGDKLNPTARRIEWFVKWLGDGEE